MIRIFDPTAGPATGKPVLVPRPVTLSGKKLAVLWNGRTHGDKVFHSMLDLLKKKYAFEVVVFLKKPYVGNIAPKEFFEKIIAGKADAALTGIGD
jgi:hypothetical protein